MEKLLDSINKTVSEIRDKFFRPTTTLVFSGNKTKLESKFDVPLPIKGKRIALQKIMSTYSVSNVTSNNNKFRFKILERDWVNGILPNGSYEIQAIQKAIEVIMKVQDENNNEIESALWDDVIEISIDHGTQKSIIKVPKDVEIDFSVNQSIGEILGTRRQLGQGTHLSDTIIMIEPVNCFCVHCDLVTGSFINGRPFQSIYQFVPKVQLGHSFFEDVNTLNFLEIPSILNEVGSISVWITDQNNRLIDLNGEEITIVLVLQ